MRVPNISGFAFWWNKGFEKTIQGWSNITGVDTGGGGGSWGSRTLLGDPQTS